MDKENKNCLTNNGAAPIEKNPFADFDWDPKTTSLQSEEGDPAFEETLDKIEELRSALYDPTIRFNNMTDEEAQEELEYAKETADDEKK